MVPIALNLFSVLGLRPTAPKAVDTGPPVLGGPPLIAAGLQKEVTATEPKSQATQLDLLEQILKWTAPNALPQDASDPLSFELEIEFGGEKVKLEVPEVLATINALATLAPQGLQNLDEPKFQAAIQRAANDETLPPTVRTVLKVVLAAVQAEQPTVPGRIANPTLNRLTLSDGSAIDPTLDRLAYANDRAVDTESNDGKEGRIADPSLNRLTSPPGRVANPAMNRIDVAPTSEGVDSKATEDNARPANVDIDRAKAFLSRMIEAYGSRPQPSVDEARPTFQTLELNLPIDSKTEGRLADPTLARFALVNPISDRGVVERTSNADTVRPILVNLLSKSRPQQDTTKPQGLEGKIIEALGVTDVTIDAIDPRPLGKPITVVPISNETIETKVNAPTVIDTKKELKADTVATSKEAAAIDKPKATEKQEEVEPDHDALESTDDPTLIKPQSEPIKRMGADKPVKQITEPQAQEVRQRVIDQVQELAAMRGRNTVTVRLNPEDLGSLTLTVLNAGENVEAKVTASNESVRHALATHRSDLVQSIESRGLSLSNFSVGQENRPDAQQQGQGNRQTQDMRQEFTRAHNLWSHTSEPATTTTYTNSRAKGIDTLA